LITACLAFVGDDAVISFRSLATFACSSKKIFFKESTYTTSCPSQARGKQQAYNIDLYAESQNWNKSLSQFCHIRKIIILRGRML